MSIAASAKYILAILAAGMGGFSVGIATTIGLIEPTAILEVPEWLPRAEWLGWVGILGASMCAVAWMYIDYRYVVEKA